MDDQNGRQADDNEKVQHEETIVIVGGGIGGLACALALHRVGMKSVVLEQSETLRTVGTSLTLWTNAFRVLDVLGVADRFRTMYNNILEFEVINQHGRRVAGILAAECEGGPHEIRAVERRVLAQVLAEQLPEETIRFNSRVTAIRKSPNKTGITEVELQNGSTYSAKVVVGFDGTRSVVASWMGIEDAKSVGQVSVRGVANFPEGHKFGDKARIFVGKGFRGGIFPSNDTKALWFVVRSDSLEGWRDKSPDQLRQDMLRLSESFHSSDLRLTISNTPPESFVQNTLRHRLNNKPGDSQVVDNVTVAGDASHPTTPNLGQGGCLALEDAIILTQKLHRALKPKEMQEAKAPEHERIHQALLEFHRERHQRTYSISFRSYMIGIVSQSNWSIVGFFRDWFLLPMLFGKSYLDHTRFDVGTLPTAS